MGYINDDDSQSMSYTTQGELKINNKYCASLLSSLTSSSHDDNASIISWTTQHGKYVSLFEPETPWHISKMKDITTSSSDRSPDIIDKKEKFNNNENKSFFDFNTIASSLLLLIVLLIIIRYYIKS